jgi:hypothetical protein
MWLFPNICNVIQWLLVQYVHICFLCLYLCMYMYLIVYLYTSHTWFCEYIIPICSCMICCFPSGCCRECFTGHTLVTRRDVVVTFCCIFEDVHMQPPNSIPLMKFFMIFRTHITIHWSCFEVCIYLFPSPVVQNELTQLKFVRLGIQLPICWWWKTISIKIKNGFDDVNCYQFVGNSVTILNFVFLLHWYALMLGPYASINVSLQSQIQK